MLESAHEPIPARTTADRLASRACAG